jgi:hypothetical protein
LLTEPVDSGTRYFLPIGVVMTNSLFALLISFSQFSATTAYGQDDVYKKIFENCRWVAQVSRDIMLARQNGQPISELLPFVLYRFDKLVRDNTPNLYALSDAQWEKQRLRKPDRSGGRYEVWQRGQAMTKSAIYHRLKSP